MAGDNDDDKGQPKSWWKPIVAEQVLKSAVATITVAIVGSLSAWIIAIIIGASDEIRCNSLAWLDLPGC